MEKTQVKRCPRCTVIRPVSEFSPDKYQRSGLASKCKPCDRELAKAKYARNKDRMNAQRSERYQATKLRALEIYGASCVKCGGTDDLKFAFPRTYWKSRPESWGATLTRIVIAGAPLTDIALELRCNVCRDGFGDRISEALRRQRPFMCRVCSRRGYGSAARRVCPPCARLVTRDRQRRRDATRRGGRRGCKALVTITQLAERDGWCCWLCSAPVDGELIYPDPEMGTFDHVVPVSKGGSDDAENLRLAHWICNVRRGNRN